MKILGIVTARGGSKRLPNKNLDLLGGKPLVAWSIEVGLATCHRVVTTTDSVEIADVADSFGSAVIIRPEELSRDDTPSEPVVVHAAANAAGAPYNAVVLLQPTSPFRTIEDVRGAIKLMEYTAADSVVSVVKFEDRGYLFGLGHAGRLRDMSHAETVYTPNGAIYLVRWDFLMEGGDWYGDHAYGYVMSPERSMDIDTHADFEAAKALLGGDGKFMPNFLKKARAPV